MRSRQQSPSATLAGSPPGPTDSRIANCAPVSRSCRTTSRSATAGAGAVSALYVSGMPSAQVHSMVAARSGPSLRSASAARSSSQERTAAAILACSSAWSTVASGCPGSACTTMCSRARAELPTMAL